MGQDDDKRRLRGFGDTTFALLSQEAPAVAALATPLPEVQYSFDAQGETARRWHVRHLEMTEGLSLVYECVVDLASETLYDSPDALLGRYAMVEAQRAAVLRRIFGVVRRVEHLGATSTHRLARVFVVPSLWTLSQRSDARIFQDMTAVEVVETVLREAGLYAGMLDVRLQREYPKREYCVQYRETDLAFVMRLLEHEGITFFFRHEAETEALVVTDGPQAWEPLHTMDGGPVPIAGAEMSTHRVETVRHLTWNREMRPTSVAARDFDFTRPEYRIAGMHPHRVDGERALYESAPAVTIHGYSDPAYTRDDVHEQVKLRHESEQVRGALGEGAGVVLGMIPGAVFRLSLAGSAVPSQRYLVTRVEHVADAPEELTVGAQEKPPEEDRYRNRFQCMPLEVPFRSTRATPKPVIAGLQTAMVTGPAGEEVYCDEHGRIKVQFHWDRAGARNEFSSCWVRVMKGPWAGGGWGFQFIPRVGMEVAVSFLEGDPDRPVVVGALHNGENEEPYLLPGERNRAGIRTQTVGGAGFNELSFEDTAGAEQVFLHAQKDLDEVVLNDHTVRVGRDETIGVSGNQTQTVSGEQCETVVGNQVLVSEGNRTETVWEHREVVVYGDQSHQILESDSVTIEGNAERLFKRDLNTRVVGRSFCEVTGEVEEKVHNDRTQRIRGNRITIVGRPEAKRSAILHVEGTSVIYSSESNELQSDRDILLRCGKSMIRLTPERLELISPEVVVRGGESAITVGSDTIRIRAKSEAVIGASTVTIKAIGSAVRLDADATVMSDNHVKLHRGSLPLDRNPSNTMAVTTIELRDLHGNPIPNQRFVITMPDGSEQTGIVNQDGKAMVELDQNSTIVFPEMVDVRPG